MEQRKYNGWTNYETWAVNLWMDEAGDYYREHAAEMYERAKEDKIFSRIERATLDLADSLKSEYEDNTPEVTGCYADLLNAALSEVNWYEIAERYQEEMKVQP